MSFIEEKLQTVQCDNCEDTYQDDDSGYGFWMDPNDGWESANNDGWTEEDGKHYCSKCHTYNDEDELIINSGRKKR